MKKVYEELKVNVISLDNTDVIATSFAAKGTAFAGENFDLGDLSVQNF